MQNFSRNAYINLAASLSQTGDATSGLQHALLFAPTKKGHCKIKGFRGNSCVKKAWSSEQGQRQQEYEKDKDCQTGWRWWARSSVPHVSWQENKEPVDGILRSSKYKTDKRNDFFIVSFNAKGNPWGWEFNKVAQGLATHSDNQNTHNKSS